MKTPRSKLRGIKTPHPERSTQRHLDVLTMERLIRCFTALLLDLLAHDVFITMTSDGTDTVAVGPQFATPSLLFDRRDALQHFPGGHPFARPHNLGGTVGGHRLHEAVHMLFIGANLPANNGIPFGDVPTDLFEHCIDTGVKPDASLLRRTDQMGHQDGDIGALRDICAHPRDNNGSKQAKQASGKLTPRD